MNSMQKYDKALMEGVDSPKRMAKKRMKAFIEAACKVAPRAIVEAVVTAHNALFEGFHGITRDGVRFFSGAPATDPRKTNNWSTKTRFNGNDAVRNDAFLKPPTSSNVIAWQKQNPEGTAAYRHYEQMEMNKPRQKIDPRGYENRYNMMYDDSWERSTQQLPPPPKVEPPPMPAPQPVRQQAPLPPPPKVEPPKVECPPVCPAPAEQNIGTPMEKKPAPVQKKPKPNYKWNDNDFHPIQKESCDPTHDFTINLVSYNKDDRDSAMAKARFLAQTKNIPGVYTYQFDGLAQNTSREDVWRVRIGFFKSKAAARTYFLKHVRPIVGDQFHWWVGTCSGDKGDKAKKGTFMLGKDITKNDCVDTSAAKAGSDNQTQKAEPAKTEKKSFMDFADEK